MPFGRLPRRWAAGISRTRRFWRFFPFQNKEAIARAGALGILRRQYVGRTRVHPGHFDQMNLPIWDDATQKGPQDAHGNEGYIYA